MAQAGSGEEIVLLPVPKQHYESMVRALAELMALSRGGTAGASSQGAYRDVPWTAEDVHRLRQEVRNKTVLALLEATAREPGSRLSFESLTRTVGRSHDETRADMAGLTRLIHRRFNRKNWPIEWEWGAGDDRQAFYWMRPEIARFWNGK